MRAVQGTERPVRTIESDLKLLKLAPQRASPEPSEEPLIELSRALERALEVVERSLHE